MKFEEISQEKKLSFSEGYGCCDICPETDTHLMLIHTHQEIPLALCVGCEELLLNKMIAAGGWKWVLTTE